MEAQEYVQYELDFDLNNPYEVTEEDVWDVSGSIGGTSNVSNDDCDERSVRWNPFHLIVTCNLVLVSLEGTWNHVHVLCPSMWVCWCILRNICKLCMQRNLTKEPLIYTSPVICNLILNKVLIGFALL
jgi:hypothetical protein